MSIKIMSPNIVYLGAAKAPSGSNKPIIVNLNYIQDTTPSNPQEKEVWYNTSDNKIYTYKNGQWTETDEATVGVWYYDIANDKYYLWDGTSLEETELNIYEKIENKTDDYTESSSIKYPSSKALSDGYIRKPTIVTDGDNTGLVIQANKIYKFATALTTLTITSAEVSDYESRIYFTTGGTIAFTDNSSLKWGGDGSAPSGLEVNTRYCIAICNGLAEIDTFGTVS